MGRQGRHGRGRGGGGGQASGRAPAAKQDLTALMHQRHQAEADSVEVPSCLAGLARARQELAQRNAAAAAAAGNADAGDAAAPAAPGDGSGVDASPLDAADAGAHLQRPQARALPPRASDGPGVGDYGESVDDEQGGRRRGGGGQQQHAHVSELQHLARRENGPYGQPFAGGGGQFVPGPGRGDGSKFGRLNGALDGGGRGGRGGGGFGRGGAEFAYGRGQGPRGGPTYGMPGKGRGRGSMDMLSQPHELYEHAARGLPPGVQYMDYPGAMGVRGPPSPFLPPPNGDLRDHLSYGLGPPRGWPLGPDGNGSSSSPSISGVLGPGGRPLDPQFPYHYDAPPQRKDSNNGGLHLPHALPRSADQGRGQPGQGAFYRGGPSPNGSKQRLNRAQFSDPNNSLDPHGDAPAALLQQKGPGGLASQFPGGMPFLPHRSDRDFPGDRPSAQPPLFGQPSSAPYPAGGGYLAGALPRPGAPASVMLPTTSAVMGLGAMLQGRGAPGGPMMPPAHLLGMSGMGANPSGGAPLPGGPPFVEGQLLVYPPPPDARSFAGSSGPRPPAPASMALQGGYMPVHSSYMLYPSPMDGPGAASSAFYAGMGPHMAAAGGQGPSGMQLQLPMRKDLSYLMPPGVGDPHAPPGTVLVPVYASGVPTPVGHTYRQLPSGMPHPSSPVMTADGHGFLVPHSVVAQGMPHLQSGVLHALSQARPGMPPLTATMHPDLSPAPLMVPHVGPQGHALPLTSPHSHGAAPSPDSLGNALKHGVGRPGSRGGALPVGRGWPGDGDEAAPGKGGRKARGRGASGGGDAHGALSPATSMSDAQSTSILNALPALRAPQAPSPAGQASEAAASPEAPDAQQPGEQSVDRPAAEMAPAAASTPAANAVGDGGDGSLAVHGVSVAAPETAAAAAPHRNNEARLDDASFTAAVPPTDAPQETAAAPSLTQTLTSAGHDVAAASPAASASAATAAGAGEQQGKGETPEHSVQPGDAPVAERAALKSGMLTAQLGMEQRDASQGQQKHPPLQVAAPSAPRPPENPAPAFEGTPRVADGQAHVSWVEMSEADEAMELSSDSHFAMPVADGPSHGGGGDAPPPPSVRVLPPPPPPTGSAEQSPSLRAQPAAHFAPDARAAFAPLRPHHDDFPRTFHRPRDAPPPPPQPRGPTDREPLLSGERPGHPAVPQRQGYGALPFEAVPGSRGGVTEAAAGVARDKRAGDDPKAHRPRLELKPRTKPLQSEEARPSAIFGEAKPREQVLAARGVDVASLDREIDSHNTLLLAAGSDHIPIAGGGHRGGRGSAGATPSSTRNSSYDAGHFHGQHSSLPLDGGGRLSRDEWQQVRRPGRRAGVGGDPSADDLRGIHNVLDEMWGAQYHGARHGGFDHGGYGREGPGFGGRDAPGPPLRLSEEPPEIRRGLPVRPDDDLFS